MSKGQVITEWSGDPRACPVCGGDNACAMAQAQADGTKPADCWCAEVSFPPELLDRLPDSDRGKACVCASCAARAVRET